MAEKQRPKARDTLTLPSGRRVKIYLVSEETVDVSPHRDHSPIPVEHFAPSGEPGNWVLIGIANTNDFKAASVKAAVESLERLMEVQEGMVERNDSVFKRGEVVRVKLLAKADNWHRGKTGIVDADSGPGEVVLVSLDDEAVVQQFQAEDLERLGK
jgi:hypothetical protein